MIFLIAMLVYTPGENLANEVHQFKDYFEKQMDLFNLVSLIYKFVIILYVLCSCGDSWHPLFSYAIFVFFLWVSWTSLCKVNDK